MEERSSYAIKKAEDTRSDAQANAQAASSGGSKLKYKKQAMTNSLIKGT